MMCQDKGETNDKMTQLLRGTVLVVERHSLSCILDLICNFFNAIYAFLTIRK